MVMGMARRRSGNQGRKATLSENFQFVYFICPVSGLAAARPHLI